MGIPGDRIVVGTVAAMARHKDYPNLLEAARIVVSKREDVAFYAIGNGPEESRIRRAARRLGISGKFIFAGFQENPQDHLAGFDVFVLASRREGFGGAAVEAQAAGLPVVACRTGGLPEVVCHGRNGLLVPPRNPEALAEAILLLVTDPRLRARLGANGARDAERFSVEVNVERTLQLYETIRPQRNEAA
jgi:glycosyltransferase involved in cell wall biosynthesis